ncbi:MAG: helix-turn-helix domain-containing protein [Pseudomonadales bacterium]
MSDEADQNFKQIIAQTSPPIEELPHWGRRVEFTDFLVELVPGGKRHFNVRLKDVFASINFAPAEGTSSLAGDRLRRYDRRPFEYILAPPLFPLKGETESAPEVLAFVIELNNMRNMIAGALGVDADAMRPEVVLGKPAPFTTALAKKIRGQLSNPDPARQYLEALCRTLIVEMFRPTVERRKKTRRRIGGDTIDMLLNYIEANLDSDLGIDKLADLVGVSNDQLHRSFKNAVGEPPHSYVVGRRTDVARDLLNQTQFSLAQIAYATGFSSQSHMTTAFRKILGTTPGAIRRAT